MNIYVGNVDYNTSEDQLSVLFREFGEVSSVKIIKDKLTGRSKGFAFIEMANDSEGQAAIEKLNGYTLNSRSINVTVARPKTESGGGGGGGFRRRGGYDRDN